jgi:hypothetical protein
VMQRYDSVNTLRFCLAHMLRTDYKQSPANFKELFETDSLRRWLATGLPAWEILRQVAGQPKDIPR